MKNIALLITFCFCFTLGSSQVNRSIDGVGNNTTSPEWGAATGEFNWVVSTAFEDGMSMPSGQDRPNAREVSNAVGDQNEFIANEKGLSDFIWGWGQFIDHDVNLNDDHPTEVLPIPVPSGDVDFDPGSSGTVEIPMKRSVYDPLTGINDIPRHFINEITAYIDGSAVYGIDDDRVNWIRSFVDGKLKVSSGNLLPYNTIDGERESTIDPSAPFMLLDGPVEPDKFFIAGDVRANEQPGLTSFHTLWVREHNRLCDDIKAANPAWNDEEIFQRARKMVGAYIQAITFEEFLPAIGISLDPYAGYNTSMNANIFNTFSAAAYRFGHTMVNGRMLRLEENGDSISFGSINLRDAFFDTNLIPDENGIEPFFRGMAVQEHQFVDPMIMNDLRNFLFGPPGAGGLDLLATNIQRARDRGLPDFNTIRQNFGLSAITNFSDFISDTDLANALSNVYGGDVNKIDPWIGLMAEDHLPNAIIGSTLELILREQFQHLRDGDRYYYENDPSLTLEQIQEVKDTRLSDIILRNTSINEIQENVFFAEPRNAVSVELLPFESIRNMKISAYPNPVQRFFTLEIKAMKADDFVLSIIDNSGKMIQQQDVRLNQGDNVLEFEIAPNYASGLYTIHLESETGIGHLKIIKN
ncbi:MAG: peroxidase family protein [Bacteroidota bacterium]